MTGFFSWLATTWSSVLSPVISTVLFFGVAIVLTLITRFAQIRAFPRFMRLITGTIQEFKDEKKTDAINPFHALFAAMATTLGMGNIVGPGIAILTGGPGALFWLIVYIFFASATKFTEVVFALETRTISADGKIMGGPMRYLHTISPFLARWYTYFALILFVGFSMLQSNTLANIYALESLPKPAIGAVLAMIVFITLRGGAQRVGDIASKLVPIMFVLYIVFAIILLSRNLHALGDAIALVLSSAFSSKAALGCFAGASVMHAMQAGVYKAIFITEAGIGTSSIPHAMAATKRPVDQGILAMFSMISDAIISITSGLLVLVMGLCNGPFRSTMIYEAFKMGSPVAGRFVLLATVTLFVVTTVIGNAFNGMQTFTSLTRYRWLHSYIALTVGMIFIAPLIETQYAWAIMDVILAFVAIPNIIGLVILAYKKPEVLKV